MLMIRQVTGRYIRKSDLFAELRLLLHFSPPSEALGQADHGWRKQLEMRGPPLGLTERPLQGSFVSGRRCNRVVKKTSSQAHCDSRKADLRNGDEFASVHSITSSASESSVGGTVRPSILAVCALMTSSNLVDCMTGKSAGLAPLRMRPVSMPTWRNPSTM